MERKYTADPPELQCNEVMLLPYYIASMNIEQEFYTATHRYLPYEGICLVDTFEMIEDQQLQLLTPANTARVKKQKESDMFVVIGNPPYKWGRFNENDNNKNRKYKTMDQRIVDTYAKDSKLTGINSQIRMSRRFGGASDRIGAMALWLSLQIAVFSTV